MTRSPTPRPREEPSPLRHAVQLALLQPLLAVPFAIFFGTLFGAEPADYGLAYRMALVFGFCIAPGVWLVRHVVTPRLELTCGDDEEGLGWRLGLWYMGVSIACAYVAALVLHLTFRPGFLGSPRAVVLSGLFALLFSALFTGINFARAFHRQAVDRARAVEQMRAELAEAELRALRAQIHPHFLFNTLNAIAALIAENPAAAEETTTRLAEVFRYTLRASEREHASLGDELDFLRAYLDIERTRLGDRLRVVERIEPGLEGLRVPSLLLQPLVENAVLHGIAPRPAGGTLTLAARRDGDRLAIEIGDDGPGLDGAGGDGRASSAGAGFGLRSVRERLRAAGQPDALTVESSPGRGTRVRVALPALPVSSTSAKGDLP